MWGKGFSCLTFLCPQLKLIRPPNKHLRLYTYSQREKILPPFTISPDVWGAAFKKRHPFQTKATANSLHLLQDLYLFSLSMFIKYTPVWVIWLSLQPSDSHVSLQSMHYSFSTFEKVQQFRGFFFLRQHLDIWKNVHMNRGQYCTSPDRRKLDKRLTWARPAALTCNMKM